MWTVTIHLIPWKNGCSLNQQLQNLCSPGEDSDRRAMVHGIGEERDLPYTRPVFQTGDPGIDALHVNIPTCRHHWLSVWRPTTTWGLDEKVMMYAYGSPIFTPPVQSWIDKLQSLLIELWDLVKCKSNLESLENTKSEEVVQSKLVSLLVTNFLALF